MDAFSAGQLSRALDRLHSTIYFAAEASEQFSELGLENQRMQYFASRSAPMGAVTAKVVAATFYNFNPELIAKAIPAAWEVASPASRDSGAIRDRRRGDAAGFWARSGSAHRSSRIPWHRAPHRRGDPECRRPAAVRGSRRTGLAEAPHVQLWHAITLLREYRGDGHIAALSVHGLSGIEALITHVATGTGFDPRIRAEAARVEPAAVG